MGFFVAGFALRHLRLESLALIERIVQLGEGIGNFPSRDIQLEAVRQASDQSLSVWPMEKSPLENP